MKRQTAIDLDRYREAVGERSMADYPKKEKKA